jgi:hypothetical protein
MRLENSINSTIVTQHTKFCSIYCSSHFLWTLPLCPQVHVFWLTPSVSSLSLTAKTTSVSLCDLCSQFLLQEHSILQTLILPQPPLSAGLQFYLTDSLNSTSYNGIPPTCSACRLDVSLFLKLLTQAHYYGPLLRKYMIDI